MGSSQSSPITAEENSFKSSNAAGGRGRKTSSSSFLLNNKPQSAPHGLTGSFVSTASSDFFKQVLADVVADLTEEPTSSCEKSFLDDEAISDDDDEEELLELERKLALNDARQLKKLAEFFLHPELPVSSEDHARCYFDRASAPDTDTTFDTEDTAHFFRDAAALKQSAIEYLHPELPVVTTDPFACGRNYFARPSATGCDDIDHTERESILSDAKSLKALAFDYMHPETPVVTSDPAACARCFFDRPSAPATVENREEFESILEDTRVLRALAKDFLHPEHHLVTSDATTTARCFFDRSFSLEQESKENDEERSLILAECSALKKLALDYKHPELPVVCDPTAFARCYFNRVSAAEQLSTAEADELSIIMADMVALKKFAVDYLHPEVKVHTSDLFATARCFFDRPSAPEPLTPEESEQREQVLCDAAILKERAVDFLHPELPIFTKDPTCTARCIFDRASAFPQASAEELEKRVAILEDLKALKRLAGDYMHPELSVVTTDPTATARCYFSRFSAAEQESKNDMEEHASILVDALHLKNLAVDFMHPECSIVSSDPCATARCFYDRPSAPSSESDEDNHEVRQVLADARALKKLAVDFLHPEVPVTTTCPYAYGRNFFDRPSASHHGRMIHTFPAHEHDEVDHLHEHMDHFGMEDFHMDDIGVIKVASPGKVDFSKVDLKNLVTDELEGNLSRSPSSVMLFQDE